MVHGEGETGGREAGLGQKVRPEVERLAWAIQEVGQQK